MTAYDPQRRPQRDYEGISLTARTLLLLLSLVTLLLVVWLITGQPSSCEQLGTCVDRSEVYR